MRKSKICTIFILSAAFLLALALSACSQTNSTGSVILSAKVPQASFSTKFSTTTSETSDSYTLEVSLSGDYEESQSQSISSDDNSKTFEFQEIPVGSKLKISAKLFGESETLYSGESDTFSVIAGENLVKISMKKAQSESDKTDTDSTDTTDDETDTDSTDTTDETDDETGETIWIAVWNRAENEMKNDSDSETTGLTGGLQMFSSITSGTQIDSGTVTRNRVDAFAFSESGDLYTLEYNSLSYLLCYYPKSDSGFTFDDCKTLDNLTDLMSGLNAGDKTVLDLKCYDGYLYLLWNSQNYNSPSTTIALLPLSAFNDGATAFEKELTAESINATYFYIADGYIYIGNDNYVCKFDLNSTTFTFDSTSDTCDVRPAQFDLSIYPNVQAIKVIDGYIYGLYAYKEMDFTTKGGIFKIDVSTMALQKWTDGNLLLGWNYTSDATESGSEEYLFHPTRFIATSPKKIVISDDGVRYPVDDNDNDSQNQNRVVTVDLETEAMSVTSVNVMFDYQKTSCGCTLAE